MLYARMPLFLFLHILCIAHCIQSSDTNNGGGSDFVGGFLLGGAVFGTLAYIFAPQVRLNVFPLRFSFVNFIPMLLILPKHKAIHLFHNLPCTSLSRCCTYSIYTNTWHMRLMSSLSWPKWSRGSFIFLSLLKVQILVVKNRMLSWWSLSGCT